MSKSTPKYTSGRPDRYSKKRSGNVTQTLRISVEENKVLREVASLERMSLNAWMARTLLAAAKKQIAAASKTE